MAIITLTTDFGDKDFYVAAVKAVILRHCQNASIVDVTHHLELGNVIQASFIVKNLYKDFPAGTIHLIGIPPGPKYKDSYIIVKKDEQYFISGNNGLFSLLFPSETYQHYELNSNEDKISKAFPVKYIYAEAACHIANGGNLEDISKPIEEVVEKTMLIPVNSENSIRGVAIYIDHYGNIITNISKEFFNKIRNGRKYKILFRGETVDTISYDYYETIESNPIALFNSFGYLEIAIIDTNASKLLGIKNSDVINIEFHR